MTTLKLKTAMLAPAFPEQPSHMPSFMGGVGVASVQVRNVNDNTYQERWVKTNAYVDCLQEAHPLEVVSFLNTGNALVDEDAIAHFDALMEDDADLASFAELEDLEPLHEDDQALMLDHYEGEFEDFVHDYGIYVGQDDMGETLVDGLAA